jgi:hypothetical protein
MEGRAGRERGSFPLARQENHEEINPIVSRFVEWP